MFVARQIIPIRDAQCHVWGSRAWHEVKVDWDAWIARDLADEDKLSLIVKGTVIETRFDRKAIQHSMNFCSWKDRKAVAANLHPIYEAPIAENIARHLDGFEEKGARDIPAIAPARRLAWAEVRPFFAFSAAIRKIIYTTNAVEWLNRMLRKTLKTRGYFPTKEAATKLIFLAIRNFEKGGRAVREGVVARNQLAIMFAGRLDACPHATATAGPDPAGSRDRRRHRRRGL